MKHQKIFSQKNDYTNIDCLLSDIGAYYSQYNSFGRPLYNAKNRFVLFVISSLDGLGLIDFQRHSGRDIDFLDLSPLNEEDTKKILFGKYRDALDVNHHQVYFDYLLALSEYHPVLLSVIHNELVSKIQPQSFANIIDRVIFDVTSKVQDKLQINSFKFGVLDDMCSIWRLYDSTGTLSSKIDIDFCGRSIREALINGELVPKNGYLTFPAAYVRKIASQIENEEDVFFQIVDKILPINILKEPNQTVRFESFMRCYEAVLSNIVPKINVDLYYTDKDSDDNVYTDEKLVVQSVLPKDTILLTHEQYLQLIHPQFVHFYHFIRNLQNVEKNQCMQK